MRHLKFIMPATAMLSTLLVSVILLILSTELSSVSNSLLV